MSFFAFGFNFESAPVEVREAFALDDEKRRAIYASARVSEPEELIILSTCNRTEFFFFGAPERVDTIRQSMTRVTGQDWSEEHAFLYEDEAAIRHVFQVASGLRSMVLGDGQILSQVKDAYRVSVEEDCVGSVLHRLMHTAFRAAKRVATETGIASGTASVASAAVAMARTHREASGRPGLAGSRVLVLGAGQMGRLALQVLHKQALGSLTLCNRSLGRAETLARNFGAGVCPWEARYDAIAEADVVIVATRSESPVLTAHGLPGKLTVKPATLIIDISVPRNVDPAADALSGYRVLDLDALNVWVRQVEVQRRADVPMAEAICDEALAEFVTWMFHQLALQPGIQAIRDTFEEIRRQEIERHHHRFSEADREELELLTRSIMQKLLSVPIVRLKSVSPEDIDFVRGIRLLQYLFSRPGCDAATEAEAAALQLPGRWPESESQEQAAAEELIGSLLQPSPRKGAADPLRA